MGKCCPIFVHFVKADNPKISGPRLCALRIQDGTSNILLDNIESESSPVIYTQRNRLLDEELDGDKGILASQSENDVRPDKNMKISMLMSDGIECDADVLYAQVQKGPDISNAGISSIYTDIPNNRLVSKASMTMISNAITLASQMSKNRPTSMISTGSYANTRGEDEGGTNQCDKYDIDLNLCGGNGDSTHCRSPCIMSTDINDTATFRRHQLTRVAQWIENNQVIDNAAGFSSSTEALSIDSGYKTKLTNSGNSAYIYRKTNSQKSLNNNVMANNSEQEETIFDITNINLYGSRSNYAPSYINNNDSVNIDVDNVVADDDNYDEEDDGAKCPDSDANADLAQMEYNVKQFLLKQNEWAHHRFSATERPHSVNGSGDESLHDVASTTQLTTLKNHRTETNL